MGHPDPPRGRGIHTAKGKPHPPPRPLPLLGRGAEGGGGKAGRRRLAPVAWPAALARTCNEKRLCVRRPHPVADRVADMQNHTIIRSFTYVFNPSIACPQNPYDLGKIDESALSWDGIALVYFGTIPVPADISPERELARPGVSDPGGPGPHPG